MAKLGVIDTQDPEQRLQIAQLFGMSNILGVHDDDVRFAAGEWEKLLAWEPPVDPMTGLPVLDPNNLDPKTGEPSPFPAGGPEEDDVFDNHAVHVNEHKKPTRSDVWAQLPPWKRLFWKQHVISHMIAMQPVIDPATAQPSTDETFGNPAKAGKPSNPTSKANEQGDKTMDTLRSGGSSAMGSGGKNQFM
jgi:hypothetical protein